jgi:transposase
MGLDRMLLGTRLGDPDQEVLGAWLAKESVRDVYLTADPADAELVLDKAIEGCRLDAVEEVRSLGGTLPRWRAEILAHHRTGASNGPTEGLNLLVKKVKRAGHCFRSFANYRLHGSCCMPAASTGPLRTHRRRVSGRGLPTETGRAA